jgi:hypothetical protein
MRNTPVVLYFIIMHSYTWICKRFIEKSVMTCSRWAINVKRPFDRSHSRNRIQITLTLWHRRCWFPQYVESSQTLYFSRNEAYCLQMQTCISNLHLSSTTHASQDHINHYITSVIAVINHNIQLRRTDAHNSLLCCCMVSDVQQDIEWLYEQILVSCKVAIIIIHK